MKMKRLISVCLAVLLLWGLVPQLGISATAAHWADSYMQNLVRRDVMKGDATGELYPNRLITRAEFAAMLNRAFGFSQRANKSFSDVSKTAWYAAEIDIAAFQGYMQGNGRGANPNGNLTREEATTMLCRALKIAPETSETFALKDERVFANWSRGYINAAVNKHFVSGYPDGSFQPSNNITRGEASKMLSAVAGEIITSNKGSASGSISGNVTIASSGVNSAGATVMGDMYLTEGVGLGYVNLRNSNVNGEFIISGAGESNVGESSVTLSDCNVSNLIVDVARQKILTLKTERSTGVANALIKSSTYLEELSSNYEGFDKVTVNGPSGTFLNLTGSFGDVRVISAGATVGLYKGQISGLTVDETAKGTKIFLEKDTYTSAIYFDTGATVTGKGQIDSVLINNDGVVIDQLPNNIYIRPGVTAKINGKVMGSLDAEMDGLSPAFVYKYPHADKIIPAGFTQYYMTNKPGKVYYAVYTEDAAAPTEEALLAKNGPPKNALKSGNLSSLPDKEGTVAVSGLKAGSRYVVYSIFVDLRGKSSNIARTYVETVDNVMPVLLSGYPKVMSLDKDGAKIALLPNKNTSYYWAVMDAKAIAPTSDQLYNQKVLGEKGMGVLHGGVMNTLSELDVTGLQEFQPYVLYVALRDGAENMSKAPYKLAFTTKDAQAPAFEKGYPKIGTVTANSIPTEVMTNEACTIYWSVAKQGTLVLPLLTNGDPEVGTPAARNIVKTGTSALKFGKATASKADTKVAVNITGLEQQMPYDIYYMLEDKAGNQSDVLKLEGKTRDIIPPTVTLESDQLIGGNYSVESPLRITFSEVVCGSELDKDSNYIRFTKMKKSELSAYIRLMDTTLVPAAPMEIDWDRVTVADVDTKTVITIPEDAYKVKGIASTLSNNNSYRFDFGYQSKKYVKDTSKNEMKSGTNISFKTVPPLTYFSEVQNFDSAEYDAVFYINPQAKNTGENIYFDILLRSSHYIEFELSEGTDITDARTMKKVTKGGKTTHVLAADYATRFTDYFDKKTTYQSLENTYYAIRLKKVGTTPVRPGETPITASINLRMNAVIGNETAIRALPGEAAGFEARLKKAVADNSISSVTAPADPFTMVVSLVDNVAPARVGTTTFDAGDRQVLMGIQTDKGCTVYYYVRPKSLDLSAITDPNVVRTQRSDPAQGTAAGSFTIPDNRADPTQHTIEGLLPPASALAGSTREYVIYYFLQGKASTPSEVFPGTFATEPTKAPVMEKNSLATEGYTNMVQMTGAWQDLCTMYYAIYPANTYTDDPSKDKIMGKVPDTLQTTSGSIVLKRGTDGITFSKQIDKIDYKFRYDLYVVGQKYVGSSPSGEPSIVYSIKGFTSRDNEAPRILTTPETIITSDLTTAPYSGSVTLQFTEGLYQIKQGSSDTAALTERLLKDNMDSSADSPASVSVLNTSDSGQDNAIQSVTLRFRNIYDGTTVNFGLDIGDKIGNRSGQFKMTFRALDAAGKPLPKPYWEAAFN